MNDDNSVKSPIDTSKVLDELSRSNSTRVNSKFRRQRLRVLVVLVLISPILMGIVWSTWNQWRIQSTTAALQVENERLSAAQQNAEVQFLSLINRINNQIGDLTAEEGVDEQLVLTLEQDFSRSLDVIRDSVDMVQRQLAAVQTRDEQWLYAEAEHLLRLANQKLQLEKDSNSAALLVSSADALLRDIQQAPVLALRQILAEDLRALRAVAEPDIAGAYMRIAALSDAIEELSLVSSLRDAYEAQLGNSATAASVTGSVSSAENGVLDAGLALLGSIFVWREWDQTPAEMLPPQQDYYIKQNLRLLLEQSQLALLMREESLFHDTLRRSQAWLSQYQLEDSVQGRMMWQEIDKLMLMKLQPELPDISASLRLLQQAGSDAGADAALTVRED
jgi:uroporphyrin-III C-methyltransferase